MKKEINSKKLEQLTNSFTDFFNNFNYDSLQQYVDDMEHEQYEVITSIIKNNVAPDHEVNHKVNKSQKFMRRIGQRFLNLFKITFTVEFAGVTLIHFTIPKVDDNGQVINKTNK